MTVANRSADLGKQLRCDMLRLVRVGIGLTPVIVCFTLGRLTERQAEQALPDRAKETPEAARSISFSKKAVEAPNQIGNVTIANVATVSFAELWDVMRAATPERREAWAREIEQLPPGTKRNIAIETFFKVWVEIDPSSASGAVEYIVDKRLRVMAFDSVFKAAADSALPSIAELMFRLGYAKEYSTNRLVLGRWAEVDPPAAAGFAIAHPDTDGWSFFNITYSWASLDPETAGQWLVKLQLQPLHDSRYPLAVDERLKDAARGLVLSWLESDRQDATAYVRSHAEDPGITDALGEFTRELCIRSQEEAKVFVLSLPNETSQRVALTSIFERIRPVMTIREGGDDEEPADPEIDSKEVSPWLAGLPPTLWIDHAGEILGAWEESDPGRASAWLYSLPPSTKAKAVIDYSSTATIQQAERVFALSSDLDTTSRDLALEKFVAYLQKSSPDPRRDIASSKLKRDQKRKLLELLAGDQ